MKKRGKKGAIQISFGMLFSIILIVAFIAVAIYVIIIFLDLRGCAETGIFRGDLQDEIDKAWQGDETSVVFDGELSQKIEKVCFVDVSKEEKGENKEYFASLAKYGYTPKTTMFFYPLKSICKGQEISEIQHLDIEKISETKNPYCINNENGKVSIKVTKGFYDSLVSVE